MNPEQTRIHLLAENLLGTLDAVVPPSTMHYAVEDARRALRELIKKADSIHTETASPGVTRRIYLDLSTSVLTETEMDTITEAPPRVIPHEYGAWVHVPPDEHDEDPLDPSGEGWEDFPNLNAVLKAARERGADWVNLDADGHDVVPGLPTYVW